MNRKWIVKAADKAGGPPYWAEATANNGVRWTGAGWSRQAAIDDLVRKIRAVYGGGAEIVFSPEQE